MVRRLLPTVLALLVLLSTATPARAQVGPGVHVARMSDVGGGAYGVGGSLRLGLPLAPVDVFLAGDYFFPDCGPGDCSLWGGSADVHFTMGLPVLTPYGTVGVVYRSYSVSDVTADATGFGLGAGIDLGTLGLGAYLEGRYEFVDPDDQFVFRLGIRF